MGVDATSNLWLGTFHAICARILRREGDRLPFKSNFIIYDSDDQVSLIKRAIQDLGINEKLYRPNSVHSAISNAKNNLIWPNDYPRQNYRDEVVGRVYGRYQQLLEASNAVDFDDLLIWPVRLFEEQPQVLEQYAQRFEHLLVDEFQDTNQAQYQLLKQLSSYHKTIFAVGDEDQSIYRWRGADYRNVLRFEQDFPACTKILLEQNYRSTQNVLDVATSVIDRNNNRTHKDLYTEHGEGEKIEFFEAPDDYSEAAYVVDTMRKLIQGNKARGSDFAVMYRTNAQSRILEEAFLRAGMAYRLVGAQRFYGRREIKDVIAYLRLINNPADEVGLQRIINVPARKIGEKTVGNLLAVAHQYHVSAGDILIELGNEGESSQYWNTFSGRENRLLADFGRKYVQWRADKDQLELPDLFDRILKDIQYHEYLDDETEDGEERWENVEELRKLAFDFKESGLTPFLETLALVSDQDTVPEKADSPTLLTLHAAKGLEFNQVFIIGVDDGVLPHSRSMESDDPEEMAEERRLFYVGITRARKKLYLVRAEQRNSYGSFSVTIPSRFLADIPQRLLLTQTPHRSPATRQGWRDEDDEGWKAEVKQKTSQKAGYTVTHRTEKDRWEATPAPSAPAARSARIVEAQFKAGERVRHPSWGEGMILESRLDDGEEMVDVHFESVGFKRLLASLANLEKL